VSVDPICKRPEVTRRWRARADARYGARTMTAPAPKHEANRRYLTPKGRALAWITRVHRGLYQMTFGLVGHTVFQRAERGAGFLLRPMKVLLLTTTGRTTGLARTVPLPYFTYDGRTFIVASFAGGDRHPAWFLNLRDDADVRIRRGTKRLAAHAAPLAGEERTRYWGRLTDDWPRYGLYQGQTTREIPLVEIVPRLR
jgi:deazaflavin-dependent oxidoreductase (nitroreductase family)